MSKEERVSLIRKVSETCLNYGDNALLPRIILHNVDLSNTNLEHVDLTGAIIQKCDLSNSRLAFALLEGALIAGSRLINSNMHMAALPRSEIYESNLSGANLSQAKLQSARFRGTSLSGSQLFGAHLFQTNFNRVDFRGVKGLSLCRDLDYATVYRPRINMSDFDEFKELLRKHATPEDIEPIIEL